MINTPNGFIYVGVVTVGSYLVQYTREGSMLTCETYHDDPEILTKVAAELHVNLCSKIAYHKLVHPARPEYNQRGYTTYHSSAGVREWAGSSNIMIYDSPVGFTNNYCPHERELVQLFTSSYNKCTKCGAEQ